MQAHAPSSTARRRAREDYREGEAARRSAGATALLPPTRERLASAAIIIAHALQ